ncbi:MAG: hypothetical protein AAF483_29770 [Planctomycetota bacterium]
MSAAETLPNIHQRVQTRLEQRRSQAAESPLARAAPPNAAAGLVEQLSREVRQLETAGRSGRTGAGISSGCSALDACLPYQGYASGTIVEYLRSSPACGASYLAFAAAASAMKATEGFLVVVDNQDIRSYFYPPNLTAQGIDLKKVVFVRPQSLGDAIWSVDQALRTPAVAAVVAELESLDDRSARRLQLAAETGNTLALLLRSASARQRPSWAEVQWLVRSARTQAPMQTDPVHNIDPLLAPAATAKKQRTIEARRLHVQLLRNRGGRPGAQLRLAIHPRTGQLEEVSTTRSRHEQKASMRLATQLANPKNPSRRASAG